MIKVWKLQAQPANWKRLWNKIGFRALHFRIAHLVGHNFQVVFLPFQMTIYLSVLISGDMLVDELVLQIGILFSLSGEVYAHSCTGL